jgi:hypothetical protein
MTKTLTFEELENITGIEIFLIRLWLDLAVEFPKTAMHTCPLTFGWVKHHLDTAIIEMTFAEYADLARYNIKSCICCKYLTRKEKIKGSVCKEHPCPCDLYENVDIVIDLVSTLLLEHRGLVNKKTQELKADLVEVRTRRSMKKVQADMLEGD